MNDDVIILLAEDDEGHALLVKRNLERAGMSNPILVFEDGQTVLDFLFHSDEGPSKARSSRFILLLDIRMPKVDGIEVLRKAKSDKRLRMIPVVMVTTTDDPQEVQRCHKLGCNAYVAKPVDYKRFVYVIQQLGLFLSIMEVPNLDAEP